MAQSTTGTQLPQNWASRMARVAVRVLADWNRDGDYLDAYEDITSWVQTLQIVHRIFDPLAGLPLLGNVGPSSASLTLNNESRWFSPNNANGLAGIYPAVAQGIYRIPVRIEMGYYNGSTPERLVQFTGYMEEPEETEGGGAAAVSITCTDLSLELLQNKQSSTLLTGLRADEAIGAMLDMANFSGQRSLDRGVSIIPYVWLDDENIWDELQAIAAADAGMFFFGKGGEATFRRFTALLERNDSRTPVATLNQGNTSFYRSSISWQNVYSDITIEYAGRYVGGADVLWESPRPLSVQPGQTVTEEARFRYPALLVYTPEADTDYVCVTAGGQRLATGAGGIQISVTPYAQRAILTITNSHSHQTAYLLDFQLRGIALYGEPAQQVKLQTTLVPPLAENKEYRFPSNPYIQTNEQASRLAGYLRDRLQYPRRLLAWRGPACPWIELLDRVTVSHNTMTPNPGINFDCYVLGNTLNYRAGAMWMQELILLPVGDLFAYDNYFILGQSTYSNTASDRVAY